MIGSGGPSDRRPSGTPVQSELEGPTLEGPGLESEVDALLPGDDEDTVSELTIPKVAREHLRYVAEEGADPDATHRLDDEEGALARAVDDAVEELRGVGVAVYVGADDHPSGLRSVSDSTQEVSETDIREALAIESEAPGQGALAPGAPTRPAESAVSPPATTAPSSPRGRTVRLNTLVVATVVSSVLAALLGSGVTFLALSSRETAAPVPPEEPAARAPTIAASTSPPALPVAPTGEAPAAVLTITPPPSITDGGGGGEGGAAAPAAADAPPAAADAAPMAADAGSDGGSTPTTTTASDADGGRGLPEEMVLPIDFEQGRPTIVDADRGELQRVADGIIANRRNRYELVGFATAEDMEDEEDRRHLAARRARRALDLLRSLGPSSQRFRARAARSSEAAPPGRASSAAGSSGAVVLRLRGR